MANNGGTILANELGTDGIAAERERGEDVARVFLRPIASPLALGFLALSGATLVLSGSQLGWVPPSETNYVAFALMAFAFPLQLLSCIFGFLARDAAATGMGILAGNWLVTGLVKYASTPASTSAALGTFLVFAGAALLIPAIGASFGKLIPALVLLTAGLRFLLTGVYQLTANTGVQSAAGIVGLVLLGIAFYAALALEIEGVRHKTLLPVLRVGAGKASIEGNPNGQLESVKREPGVREQL